MSDEIPYVLFAIDPGLSGAIAYFKSGVFQTVWDVPCLTKRSGRHEVSVFGINQLFSHAVQGGPRCCLIERVAAMPGQGVSSMFALGDTFGALRAVAEVRCKQVNYVAPVTWKKAVGLTKDKDYSRTLALRYYPEASALLARKKDHNRAEAILLARYALQNVKTLF